MGQATIIRSFTTAAHSNHTYPVGGEHKSWMVSASPSPCKHDLSLLASCLRGKTCIAHGVVPRMPRSMPCPALKLQDMIRRAPMQPINGYISLQQVRIGLIRTLPPSLLLEHNSERQPQKRVEAKIHCLWCLFRRVVAC